jgi:hypothetical protein
MLIFVAYVILLAITVSRHEPWMDEAQPWLLVNDFSITELFTKYLRYDGHPALWYLLVMIPAKLGFSYFSLSVLSAVFSAAGVFLFLRYSPFPLIVKALFPFTYFTFYQYGVVARSYCLVPLFLFLIAIKYEKKIEQPIFYASLLALFANVSAHTWLIACALFALYLFDVIKTWTRLDKIKKIRHAAAVLIYALGAGFVVLTLLPPPDQTFARANNYSLLNFLNSSKWMLSGSLVMDESSQYIDLQIIASLLIIALTFFWLSQKKLTLVYLLPLLFNLLLFAVKYRNLWHEGILFFLWVFVLWLSFAKEPNENRSNLARIVLAMMTIVFSVHAYWSFCAVRFDLFQPYSGSYATAKYIKGNELDKKRTFISGWKSIAILPYFDRNIFYNLNNGSQDRIWFWSTSNQTPVGFYPQLVDLIQTEKPDTVIFASDHLEPNTKIELEGYNSQIFAGSILWKTGVYESDSFYVFRKAD